MKIVASLFVLVLLAAPAFGQRETIEGTIDSITPSSAKYGDTLVVKGTARGAVTFKNGNKLFVRVLVYQGGTARSNIVYQRDEFVKVAGTYSVSFPLLQQDTFTAAGIFWDQSKSATGVVQLIHFRQRGQTISTTIIAGPVQISIGPK